MMGPESNDCKHTPMGCIEGIARYGAGEEVLAFTESDEGVIVGTMKDGEQEKVYGILPWHEVEHTATVLMMMAVKRGVVVL